MSNETAKMKALGYNYQLFISRVPQPLYIKSSNDAGPLMRELYPTEKLVKVVRI